MNDRHSRSGLITSERALFDRRRDSLPDLFDGGFKRLFRHVYKEDIPSCGGQHLRDAAPHLSRAYDPDGLDVVDRHSEPLFTVP